MNLLYVITLGGVLIATGFGVYYLFVRRQVRRELPADCPHALRTRELYRKFGAGTLFSRQS